MNTSTPQRVLIVRLSAIGDIVMASGLIPALRSLWPEAHIAWLAETGPSELLRANPRLDEVIELPRQRWKTMTREGQRGLAIKEMWGFAKRLREQSFDLTIDLQGLLKSGVWAFASGAPRRIGLGSKEGSQWLMTECLARNETDPRMGKEYRALAVSLGAQDADFTPDIQIPDALKIKAQAELERLFGDEKVALLAPFTTRPQKHWFNERWVTLSQGLRTLGYRSLILGGPADLQAAEDLARCMGPDVVSLAGKSALLESAALIQKVNLLIGVDTGLTHLGKALGTPTIALFGSTLPYWEAPTSKAEILFVREPCSPCHRKPVCNGLFTCMRHLEPQGVLDAVRRITPP
ncbi:MAG TPA: lipopolysaccharide heptosyltransferase [Methylococcaceae bacterium]|jgi:heptosyltransferase-1|nr:lipopolysaccharide heptosyltransferase [Methylococcaceae bacterium]